MRARRLSTVLLVAGAFTWLFPALAGGAENRPRKIVNLKAGAGVLVPWEGSDRICSEGMEIPVQLGLQTAFFPWTVEAVFYTDTAVELSAGVFWPAVQLGRGWLTFSSAPFFRAARDPVPTSGGTCADASAHRVVETWGVAAAAEYLMYDGYLGFYVETRQALLDPASSWVGAGVTVSPLLWLLWRNQ